MSFSECIRDFLRFRFGSPLADDPALFNLIAGLLRSWSPEKESLFSLSGRMEELLFNYLYEHLGPCMTWRSEDGILRRIFMSDLPFLADEALYPLFASFAPSALQFRRLYEYWIKSGSFSALRVLFLHFANDLPEQEHSRMEQIIQENVPPFLQERWFGKGGFLS